MKHEPYFDEKAWNWYCIEDPDCIQSFSIPESIFNKLQHGVLFPLMRIRKYTTKKEAELDYKQAIRSK